MFTPCRGPASPPTLPDAAGNNELRIPIVYGSPLSAFRSVATGPKGPNLQNQSFELGFGMTASRPVCYSPIQGELQIMALDERGRVGVTKGGRCK